MFISYKVKINNKVTKNLYLIFDFIKKIIIFFLKNKNLI